MANIHTLRDLRAQTGPPSRAAQYSGGSGRPQYSRAQQQSHFSAVDDHREVLYGAQTGISMMAPPIEPGQFEPELSQRLCPRIRLRAVTAILCIIQVILFITTLIVGSAKFDGAFVSSNTMAGPSAATLEYMGGKYLPKIRDDGEVWRLLTCIFLHAGILHLISNMFFQCRFGFTLEDRWGVPKFLLIYILTGINGALWSCQFSPWSVSVGASGALFGLVGADMTYLAYNWHEIPHNQMEACMLVFVTVVNFLFGMGSSIDNYAHLGGWIGGLFLGGCMPPVLVNREKGPWIRRIFAVGFCGLFLLFVLLVFVGDPRD